MTAILPSDFVVKPDSVLGIRPEKNVHVEFNRFKRFDVNSGVGSKEVLDERASLREVSAV